MLDQLPQILVNALVLASIFSLLATGLSLAYSGLGLINFVHGQIAVLGSFGALVLSEFLGLNFLLTLVVVPVVFIGIGFILERTAIRFVAGMEREFQGMIFTLGLAIIIQNALILISGPDPRGVAGIGQGRLTLGTVNLAYDRLLVIAVAVVVLSLLMIFLKTHKLGLALRALSMDREALAASGVRTPRVAALGYGLACALAAVAGAAIAPIQGASPIAGDGFLLQAFLVVIIGGLGSLGGAIGAAIILALVQSAVGTLYSASAAVIISFVGVMLLLAFRPEGLARAKLTRA